MSCTSITRLRMVGIDRRFGSTQALQQTNLVIAPGEVHALIGENGAGKSTLMKILSGAERPDAGQMWLDEQRYCPRDAKEARRLGVAMIYQELTLAPHLSVQANVLLGQEPTSWFGLLNQREGLQRVESALRELGHPEIDPAATVDTLGPGAKQVVEIARALLTDVRLLVLDEPTSSLSQQDTANLFKLIRRLRDKGVSVVYISHFLEEVQQIADRFTVLRDGQSVQTGALADFEMRHIIESMVGRSLDEQFPRVAHSIGEPLLELNNLSSSRGPDRVNMVLHRGEILGIAGIVGAGRTELLRAVFALDPIQSGNLRVLTIRSTPSSSATPAERISQGLGMLSEDRKGEGLALIQSISDNLTYSRLAPYSFLGYLNLSRRQEQINHWVDRLRIRCHSPEQHVGQLSGGNQQKVALGRLLHQHADVLLLDEPTRGVDIGSKAEIYQLIGEQAATGKAILFVSSYLPELLGVCDRLAVMVRGTLSEIRSVEEWTAEEIMTVATGGTARKE